MSIISIHSAPGDDITLSELNAAIDQISIPVMHKPNATKKQKEAHRIARAYKRSLVFFCLRENALRTRRIGVPKPICEDEST